MTEPVFPTAFAAGFAAASAAIALPDGRYAAETTAMPIPRNTADRFIRLLLPNVSGRILQDAIRNDLLRRPPECAHYTIRSPSTVPFRFRGVARSPGSPKNHRLCRTAPLSTNSRKSPSFTSVGDDPPSGHRSPWRGQDDRNEGHALDRGSLPWNVKTDGFGQQWTFFHPAMPVMPAFGSRLHIGQPQQGR